MATPAFIKHSNTDSFIDFDANIEPTVLAFAHRRANYLVELTKSEVEAWGPVVTDKTNYLYWDVNLISGEITRGITLLPVMYSGSAPTDPLFDQHWFDLQNTVMKTWNGRKWLEVIRVFAGEVRNASTLVSYAASSSQAGLFGALYETGNIIYDVYGKPLRQSDGTFATSSTQFVLSNTSSKSVKLEGDLITGQAAEPIPAFSLVRQTIGSKIRLAISSDPYSRVCGIVTSDLYPGEVGYVTSNGLIKNPEWHFPENRIGRPVFCGAFGNVTVNPPTSGVLQIIGYVFDKDTVNVAIQQVIILDSIAPRTDVIPTVIKKPLADFTPSVTSGIAPLTVKFTNGTMNGATSFIWDFTGSGAINSTEIDPVFQYVLPGTYSVTLTAANTSGTDTITKHQIINVLAREVALTLPNLAINLGSVSQIRVGTSFTVSIHTSNSGNAPATNVKPVLRIPDVRNRRIEVLVVPGGSTVSWDGDLTTIELPELPAVTAAAPAMSKITLKAPTISGVVRVFADVSGAQHDKTAVDNVASVSIEVFE